jgi:hypothetical protein
MTAVAAGNFGWFPLSWMSHDGKPSLLSLGKKASRLAGRCTVDQWHLLPFAFKA